jgi:hypothetical protein
MSYEAFSQGKIKEIEENMETIFAEASQEIKKARS